MQADYYRILGLPRIATTSEIKARYKILAHRHHPDHQGDNATMSLINQAYGVLSDPRQRYEYNQKLGPVKKESNFTKTSSPPKTYPKANYYRPPKVAPKQYERSSSFSHFFSPISVALMLVVLLTTVAIVKSNTSSTPTTLNVSGAKNTPSISSSLGKQTQNTTATNSTLPTTTPPSNAASPTPTSNSVNSTAVNPSCQVSSETAQQEAFLSQQISNIERRLDTFNASGGQFGYSSYYQNYSKSLEQKALQTELSNDQTELSTLQTSDQYC